MMPTEEFLDEDPPPSSKGKRSSKESSNENRSSSKKRSSKKRSSKVSDEDNRSPSRTRSSRLTPDLNEDRSRRSSKHSSRDMEPEKHSRSSKRLSEEASSNPSSKDKKTKKKSKERKSRSSKSHKTSSSKHNRSKSSSLETNEEDVNVAPTLVGLAPISCDSGDFAVRKGTEVEKRWDNFSNAQKTAQADLDDSNDSSNQFDAFSMASGFSMPVMQPQTSPSGLTERESVSRPGASRVASRQGALYVSNTTDKIQELLDRKLIAFEGQKEEEAEVMPAVISSQVGAHYESAMPVRIQNMINRKFSQFKLGNETRAEQGTMHDPVQEKMNSFAPYYVSSKKTGRISSKEKYLEKMAGEDDDIATEESSTVEPTAAMQFSAWNYGKGSERHSIAAPPPDILTNHLIDDQEFALSGIERKEMRLAAGLCVECGRTQTHEKIKYGPFQAFRRMEPLTTPGHVYKGYCLFCNNILELRRYLQEPYLREQDLDGTMSAALVKEALINIPSSDESMSKTRRIQVCLCIGVLAIIAVVVGLVISFTSTTNATPSTGSEQSFPPTAAPGPLGWSQVGSDISESVPSFGYKVAISSAGNRVAVSSPKALQSTGRADIFEFVHESNKWVSIGSSILGDFAGDQTGYGIDLSNDGNNVIVGYPGNGAGFVRVFRYGNNQWQQVGGTLVGGTPGGWFGASVAINPDGSSILVGAPYDTNDNGSEAGRARVYQLKDNEWTQVGSDLLGRAALDNFGMSVAISDSGEVLAVGAPNNDDQWQDGGQVHIFQLGEDTEGKPTWIEPLDQWKILGQSDAHQFGTVVSMNGSGDTVASSAVNAENHEGTDGGGDPRVVYIDYTDMSAEELGYGFSAIPGTIGLGYSIDVDLDGTKVIASTLNHDGRAGKAMTYDITGKADWYAYPSGVEFGGEKLGPDVWLGRGPSVSMSSTGSHFAIGYESIVVDSRSQGARPAVRVYFYGYGET